MGPIRADGRDADAGSAVQVEVIHLSDAHLEPLAHLGDQRSDQRPLLLQ
jgi:hypothetical protein